MKQNKETRRSLKYSKGGLRVALNFRIIRSDRK